jgi:hypothetical protein
MIRSATTPDALDHNPPAAVAAAWPEEPSEACPAATGPFRGIIVALGLVVPFWALVAVAIHFVW